MKFPIPYRVSQVWDNQVRIRCYMTSLQEMTINKPDLRQSSKVVKERNDNCKMIFTKSLDLRDGKAKRNIKLTEFEIKEIMLFDEFNL